MSTTKRGPGRPKLATSPENMSLLMHRQNENRAVPTPAEAHVKGLLESLGEQFVFEKGIFTTWKFIIVDFYLPKPRKLCIEIDGDYHSARKFMDEKRDRFLREERKMRVLRITNDDALRLSSPQLLALIEGACG